MIELYEKNLPVQEIIIKWYETYATKNYGALIHFIGIVRDEDGIDGLSFDVYKPLLKQWFDLWQEKASKQDAKLLMAHSTNDVLIHQSSYIAGVLSPKRKVALRLINEFVEDFKKNAPIWKYELKNNKRIYVANQSQAMDGAGLLG